jgi:DNA-binding transcriptional LysR family regulator
MRNWDWDDYRYFSAVARAGSVRAAAADLGVNASTVTRRLEQLERRIGVELFTRLAHGLQITAHGLEVAARVEQIGRELLAIDSELREDQDRLTGEVVLGIPQSWLPVLMNHLGRLHEAEPGLDIELLDAATFNPHSGADLWIEATFEPATDLIARPLGRPLCGLYGRRDLLAGRDRAQSFEGLFWLSLEDPLLGSGVEPPLRDPGYSSLPVRLQTRSILQQRCALEAGLGIGTLPMAAAAASPVLDRIGKSGITGLPHWLVSRTEMRRVRRLQVVSEWLRRTWALPDFGFTSDEGRR